MEQESNLVGLDGKKLEAPTKSRRYPIIYNIQTNEKGWTEEEFKKNEWGGCDQMVVFAITKDKKGGRNDSVLSIDGLNKGEEIPALELFKSWATMAAMLKDHPKLGVAFRALAGATFHSIQKILYLRNQVGSRGKK